MGTMPRGIEAVVIIPPSFAYADGCHVGIDIVDADIPYSHPVFFSLAGKY